MSETYVTSDIHFGDETVRKLNRPQYNSNEEMNDNIIEKWNKVVAKDDLVYILGDIGRKNCINYYKKMNGHKILILGNHDVDEFGTDHKVYLDNGFDEVFDYSIKFDEFIELSHEPQPINTEYRINLHGHMHNAKLPLKGYFNVCMDQNFFKPVNINNFLRFEKQLKQVRKKFGKEWYYNYYSFVTAK